MSHFIQDDQAVIQTLDDKYLLLTKGGSNNTSSAISNRRCTSWNLDRAFDSKESYMNFIDVLMMSDISGGMWQFNSLKNKHFVGFTEYENKIYTRFEKAFNRAYKIEFSLKDLSQGDIFRFEEAISSALLANNHSLKNEDGIEHYLKIAPYSSNSDKEALERLNNIWTKKPVTAGYREFCKKYSKTTQFQAFKSVDFCKALNSFRIYYGGAYSLENSKQSLPITLDGFLALYQGEEERLLRTYNVEHLLTNYPYHFYTMFKTTSVLKSMEKITSEADSDYTKNRYSKNLEAYVSFLDKDHMFYKEKKDAYYKAAKNSFVDTWNSLDERSWYVQTDAYIPNDLDRLSEFLEIGDFSLEEIADDCRDTFYNLIHHHRHQRVKNKKAVKLLAKTLIEEYSELLKESTIDSLCKYFEVKKPAQDTFDTPSVAVIQPTVDNPSYQNGRLF